MSWTVPSSERQTFQPSDPVLEGSLVRVQPSRLTAEKIVLEYAQSPPLFQRQWGQPIGELDDVVRSMVDAERAGMISFLDVLARHTAEHAARIGHFRLVWYGSEEDRVGIHGGSPWPRPDYVHLRREACQLVLGDALRHSWIHHLVTSIREDNPAALVAAGSCGFVPYRRVRGAARVPGGRLVDSIELAATRETVRATLGEVLLPVPGLGWARPAAGGATPGPSGCERTSAGLKALQSVSGLRENLLTAANSRWHADWLCSNRACARDYLGMDLPREVSAEEIRESLEILYAQVPTRFFGVPGEEAFLLGAHLLDDNPGWIVLTGGPISATSRAFSLCLARLLRVVFWDMRVHRVQVRLNPNFRQLVDSYLASGFQLEGYEDLPRTRGGRASPGLVLSRTPP